MSGDAIFTAPAYLEAVAQEQLIRDAAYLSDIGISEKIGPFDVHPLRLWHWVLLRTMESPLLYGGLPGPVELSKFIWVISEDYSMTNKRDLARFLKRCGKVFMPPSEPFFKTKFAMGRFESETARKMAIAAELIKEARVYVKEAMQDRPGRAVNQKHEEDYYSDSCFFCALFGREYGWSREVVLNTPMKIIFQHLNEIKQQRDPKAILFNPSGAVLNRILLEQSKN